VRFASRAPGPLEERVVEHRLVGAGQPAALPVRQLAEVEAILEQDADAVLGEGVAATVAGAAVAGGVERLGHLAVAPPLGRQPEGHQQAGVGLGVGHRQAPAVLLEAEGQQAVVEALGLALGLALLRLPAQVVGVVLSE
jgi:hypothetical protein